METKRMLTGKGWKGTPQLGGDAGGAAPRPSGRAGGGVASPAWRRRAAAAAGTLALLICCLFFWGGTLITVRAPLKPADALVLLAGDYRERAPLAAQLYRSGYAPLVILTNDGVRHGWSRERQRNLYAIERCQEELLRRGVPQRALVLLPFRDSGTVHDALLVRDQVLAQRLSSILLVTSDYHTRRALWIFRRVFHATSVKVSVAGTKPDSRSLVPCLTEYLKLAYYLTRYGLLGDLPAPAPHLPPRSSQLTLPDTQSEEKSG